LAFDPPPADLDIAIWNLPFDFAQGGEPVEPFVIWCLYFVISGLSRLDNCSSSFGSDNCLAGAIFSERSL
jgi:hypothetical protein